MTAPEPHEFATDERVSHETYGLGTVLIGYGIRGHRQAVMVRFDDGVIRDLVLGAGDEPLTLAVE